jgi:biopolymer transport protein TolR
MIKKDTTLAVRDHSQGGMEFPVSRDELVAVLNQKLAKNSEQSVVISADKNVRYEEVINVMDMLQQQHVKKVGLLTKPR